MGKTKLPVTVAAVGRIQLAADELIAQCKGCIELIAQCPENRRHELAIAGLGTVLLYAGKAASEMKAQKLKVEGLLGKIQDDEKNKREKAATELGDRTPSASKRRKKQAN